MAAGAAGKVVSTYVERGSVVSKGAVLAKLDARALGAQAAEAAAQVESLKAQQAQAQLDCQRNDHMFEKGAISKADYDRAQTQCATSKWSVSAAEARKTPGAIAAATPRSARRSPGWWSSATCPRASTSGVDTPVVSLVDVDALRVELTVPEADVAGGPAGHGGDLQYSRRRQGVGRPGQVRYIGPSVREQTRDAVVEATVDNAAPRAAARHVRRRRTWSSASGTLPAVPQSGRSRRGDVAPRVHRGRWTAARGAPGAGRRTRAAASCPSCDGVKAGDMVVVRRDPRRARRRTGGVRTPCSGSPAICVRQARLRVGADPGRSSSSASSATASSASIASPTSTSPSSSSPPTLPGAAPEDVETELTDKIEEAVNTISGIDELRSVSTEGVSQVFVTVHPREGRRRRRPGGA